MHVTIFRMRIDQYDFDWPKIKGLKEKLVLDDTREKGYASAVHTRRVSDEISMAVPIVVEDQVLATVVVRFAETAVPFKIAAERFVPKLRDAAHRIKQTFIEQQLNPPHQHVHSAPAR